MGLANAEGIPARQHTSRTGRGDEIEMACPHDRLPGLSGSCHAARLPRHSAAKLAWVVRV